MMIKELLREFWWMPVIVVAAGLFYYWIGTGIETSMASPGVQIALRTPLRELTLEQTLWPVAILVLLHAEISRPAKP